MPGAHQHAALLRDQREHMAGLHDVLGPRVGRGRDLDGERAVVRRDAGGDAFGRFDGDGEVGAVAGAVMLDHWPQPQARGVLTSGADGSFHFRTIVAEAYPIPTDGPVGDMLNATKRHPWRPAHLHFSVFGIGLAQRLVTQMYFPGDPLISYDPMFNSVPDDNARQRLISQFDWEGTIPDFAIAFRFDIVLRGREQTFTQSTRS